MTSPVHELSDTQVTEELNHLCNKYGFSRPERSQTDPSRPWLNGVPNYDRADLLYLRGKSKNHAKGSIEYDVENFVKHWEMEASHLKLSDWTTTDHNSYAISANGGYVYNGTEAGMTGFYNLLLKDIDKTLYDSENESPESSTGIFQSAFLGGFPWEVVEVFSGPPSIAFSWRHWATFNGVLKGRKGDGKSYELFGFSVVDVNEDGKMKNHRIFFKPEVFIKALHGLVDVKQLEKGNSIIGSGCPILSKMASSHSTS